jgi:hypothetical protein
MTTHQPAPKSALTDDQITSAYFAVLMNKDGELGDALRAVADAAVAAHVAQQVPDEKWISVDERLPESGRPVLATYLNRCGKPRRIRAEWMAAKTLEVAPDDDSISEYDDDTDAFYLPQGWYEIIDNWDDFRTIVVTEGEVSHWMPLPAPPQGEKK